MKRKSLFFIALAGLMLGSCSKDVIDNGGNGASWNENGTGYINLAINLPAVSSGSRAGDATTPQGPTFDDGEGHEYAVEDATLMLFTLASTGSSEDDAKLHSVYDMSTNFRDDTSDQITQTAGIVQEIKEIGGEDQILALVVLNRGGLFTVNGNLLQIDETSYGAINSGTELTFGNLNTTLAGKESDDSWITDGYFLMSNAPLFNKQGGSTTTAPTGDDAATTTLFKIDRGNIAKSISQAAEKPASRIFVERAQAKIELKAEGNTNGFVINDWTNVEQYKLYITKWGIDNYNNHSRLTRKFNKDWAGYENASSSSSKYYRFVDAAVIDDSGYYRTYWGEDVNYTTASTTGGTDTPPALVSIKDESGLPKLNVDFGKCAYCFENTVDQVPAEGTNLTRIILETELRKQNTGVGGGEEPATDFFTVNTDGKTIYFNGDKSVSSSIQARIIAHVLSDPEVAKAAQDAGVSISKDNLTFAFSSSWSSRNSGILNNKEDFIVTYSASTVRTTEGDIQTAINNSLYSESSGTVTNKINIDYHKGGKSYYQVFIRHFNNYECPWDEETKPDQSSNKTQYLGRYGVLRNSWYVINVNSINNVGDSVYPVIPTDPVDKEEFFLAVEINIMPWAKRQQDVDL